MRGQVFNIDGKKIFAFGGGYSIDKYMRRPHISWWPQEMPTKEEMDEGIDNLKAVDNKVDYIITHTAPEDTMNMFHPYHPEEKPLNNYLEYIRENVEYRQWYFGHMHGDRELWRNQTMVFQALRNMETNEVVK